MSRTKWTDIQDVTYTRSILSYVVDKNGKYLQTDDWRIEWPLYFTSAEREKHAVSILTAKR